MHVKTRAISRKAADKGMTSADGAEHTAKDKGYRRSQTANHRFGVSGAKGKVPSENDSIQKQDIWGVWPRNPKSAGTPRLLNLDCLHSQQPTHIGAIRHTGHSLTNYHHPA